ncbi:MAG: HAMP domain-containing histidine kinase [Cyclobacteriaceae bacterium]|nr:HAMP domain-containing histidine kinase [Cyclobacteriaceae bacterium]
MTKNNKTKETKILPLWGLLVSILISSIVLIAINFYTLKTMSSVRAYINGESNYSKGEKNATQSLISYLHTADIKYWEEFESNISIPRGDSIARATLLENGSRDIVRNGFLQGINHKDDIEDMIWLFNTFKNLPLLAGSIATWKAGDSLIYQKYIIACQIRSAIENRTIEMNKEKFLAALARNRKAFNSKEMEFSASLGTIARKIRDYLFYANTIILLLILGNVSAYAMIMVRRRKEQNRALSHANKELDRIAHTLSHDLKAPINSLLGLLNLAKKENDPESLKTYFEIMQRTLDKQERFIKEMIAISKENRKTVKKEIVELDYLIEQVINMHKHMPAASDIKFKRHIGVHRIFADLHRLEIILNNLVSNAIKYHDQKKNEKIIEINTYSEKDKIRIDVTDNGIGIENNDKSKIFEMYYMSSNREKGSGLGLFLVKEALEKLEGEILVKSVKGEGSTFSVILKK